MTAPAEPPSDSTGPDQTEAGADATFDEVREAAGAVIASLKQLIEATERVVADPGAFASAVEGGRSIVDAFVSGFNAPDEADESSRES